MFLELAKTLRSLTASPAQTAINSARRQARRYLDAGGAAKASQRQEHDAGDVLLPVGVDLRALRAAVEAKLGVDQSLASSLRVTADGRVVVPRELIERLGDGAVERGVQFLADCLRSGHR